MTWIGLLGLCVAASGCASFRSGNLAPISTWPPAPTASKRAIVLAVSGRSIMNGDEEQVDVCDLATWREQAVRAYTDSELFSKVGTEPSRGALRVEVTVTDDESHSMLLWWISGLSAWIIPDYGSNEFTVETTLKDPNGRVLGQVRKSEKVNYWEQILMLFATPFACPSCVIEDTLYDLNRATLVEAREKKLFD